VRLPGARWEDVFRRSPNDSRLVLGGRIPAKPARQLRVEVSGVRDLRASFISPMPGSLNPQSKKSCGKRWRDLPALRLRAGLMEVAHLTTGSPAGSGQAEL
jgi:hypothetical protein